MAGIILAGGRSQRMGRDKALLPFAGTSLLCHVARNLLDVVGQVIIVAGAADAYASLPLPVECSVVGDLYPGQGPLGGIAAGLRAAGEGSHLVVACDMPMVQPAVVELLLGAVGDRDAAIPEVGGRLQPLCAAYDSRAGALLEARVRAGELSVTRAVRDLDLVVVAEAAVRAADPELASFTNLNTPGDYHKHWS